MIGKLEDQGAEIRDMLRSAEARQVAMSVIRDMADQDTPFKP